MIAWVKARVAAVLPAPGRPCDSPLPGSSRAAGDMLLFVSWPHRSAIFPRLSRRLGIVFCFNRPCALHAVFWPQHDGTAGTACATVCITPSLSSAFSPRFAPPPHAQHEQQQLVFLSQAAAVSSGVHSATSVLHSLSWQVSWNCDISASTAQEREEVLQVLKQTQLSWYPEDPQGAASVACSTATGLASCTAWACSEPN